MSRPRTFIFAAATLSAALWTHACGDGTTGPPAPPPDPPRPTTVTVSPATAELTALDATVQFSAEVRDQNGQAMAGATVTWASSAPDVATVNASGLATATENGMATITATAGSASGTAVVTVMQSAGSVIVSPSADTIAPDDTLRLVAEAIDENGHRVQGADFTWSSSDVSVATVDARGLVTGIAEGTATITATAGDASGTSEITVENPDRAALVALYNATDGPNWANSANWLTGAPLGEWYGVGTDGSGRVVSLDLSGRWDNEAQEVILHGLKGTIPAELGALSELRAVDLSRNELSGPIPPELGSLANLRRLDLLGNDLTGAIPPELGNLANLAVLRVARNRLSGPIPSELGSLANLTWLDFGPNELTGPIPSELGGLDNLEYLDLGNNELSGPIPPELGSLTKLTNLNLPGNELTGPIPPELGNLSNLAALILSANKLTGPIPQSLLRLDRLGSFYVGGNESVCVPGSSAFVAWLREIKHRDDDSATILCNAGDVAALKQLYRTAGGMDWTESTGWPGDGAVEEWHGVSTDSLGQVTVLDLTRNGLSGRLPLSLDAMTHMTELRIGGNPGLSGRLPLSLARLSLRTLHYSGTSLCAPAEPSFRAWLGAIPSHEGTGVQCAPLSDRDVLEVLYDATGGPDWTNSDNWLTDAPLEQWHGVRVDGEDRVTVLELRDNSLKGPIPPELGNLANLTSLALGQNDLTGPLPPELGDLSQLASLSVGSNKLTGPIPSELGKLSNLRYLGLSFNDSMGPIPPEIGNLANLTGLWAQATGLSGSIPPELGQLASLRDLLLGYGNNTLTGRIPPEIGNLANLERLDLWTNSLTGPIPPALGNLESLVSLQLYGNNLTGPIPPGLGNLANLESLWLNSNGLSGPIPPELGRLRALKLVRLDHNALTGALPPAFGNMTTVEELLLDYNDLEGPVPPEFGRMSSLRRLSVTNNPAMAGPLPGDLTALHQLEALLAGGTQLCALPNPEFHAWLEGVHKRRIAPCAADGPSGAYLIQAVQSREFPVPLVAGEEALLRVFVTAGKATSAKIPPVRARFYLDGRETHVVEIPGKSDPIPTEVDESHLSKSANAEIPGNVVQPGLEMVIEVDPDGTLAPELGVAKRVPETGRMAVDVRTMPLFDLTLIPFVWTQTRDSSIVDLVEAMAADPENHEMLLDTRTLLPIGDFAVTAHEPVLSSSNDANVLFRHTEAIRAMEGGTGYYKGMMAPPVTSAGGIGKIGGRWSFSQPYPDILAHELGHNLSLRHPPGCDAGGTDGAFPYSGASTGSWGYDFREGSLVRPSTPDVMSYCGPPDWISDYHFTNALRYRLFDERPPAAAAAAGRSLLLWGGVSADSVPYLEPAFVVEGPAALPDSAGEYQISGRTETGTQLFALRFAMPETADGDGSSSFAFMLPVRPEWEGNLASISLTGPGRPATLDGDSDIPMVILRNAQTGEIRGILRDSPPAMQAAADAVGEGGATRLEVLFSRGIPGAEAWRR